MLRPSIIGLLVLAAAARAQGPSRDTVTLKIDVEDAIARGELSPKSDPDALAKQAVEVLQARLLVFARTATMAVHGHEVVLSWPGATRERLLGLARLLSQRHRLEIRALAKSDDREDGVSFDMAEECRRLKAWLSDPAHRQRVQQHPEAIEAFDALPTERGGPASRCLRWAPHPIRPSASDPKVWDFSFASSEQGVVPAFSPQEYARGPRAEEAPFLVELFPINMHEEHFTGADIDPATVARTPDPTTGQPALLYQLKNEQANRYADFSAKYLHEPSAILVDGVVREAPIFQARIYGQGLLSGDFSAQELDGLAQSIRVSDSLPVPVTVVAADARGRNR